MRILITGGAGFAGAALTKELLNLGHKVTCFDVVAPLMNDALWDMKDHENLSFAWKGLQDIRKEDIEGHNIVIHLAAQADVPMGFKSPLWTVEQNVVGSTCLLDAVKESSGVEKVIYAGSGNEWGRPQYIPIDENHPLTPHNPYSFSKAAAELAFWAYHRCYDVPVVIMSNGIVTGPGMRREIFIFKWLYNILRGLPIVLEGGDQTRDITYTSDVIQAWLLAINAPAEKVVGEKFQVSYGEEHSVEEIMEMCLEECGAKVPVIRTSHRPGEKGQREAFDNSKAREILGYKPQVGPREAIRLTKEWIAENFI